MARKTKLTPREQAIQEVQDEIRMLAEERKEYDYEEDCEWQEITDMMNIQREYVMWAQGVSDEEFDKAEKD